MRRIARLLAAARYLLPPLLLATLVGLLAWRGCGSGGGLDSDERATIALFERASPSVVHVSTLVRVRDRRTLNPLDVPSGTGTGFLWDAAGHVVTNFHVVAESNQFMVALSDGVTRRAVLVGTAAPYDLAVLKIEPEGVDLAPLPLGSSSDLRVGQKVFAIGNPFGLDQTLTHGIVSGLGREIASPAGRTIYDVIQTDAAINPGNSGGPLLDSAGRMIGVNTQIASPSGGSAGIGFAIPIDIVARVVPDVIEHGGRYLRPVLGVVLAPNPDERTPDAAGAFVEQVSRGSGAAVAGIEPNDMIVEVSGQPVRTRVDLFRIVDRLAPGNRVAVTYRRGGVDRKVEVELSGAE